VYVKRFLPQIQRPREPTESAPLAGHAAHLVEISARLCPGTLPGDCRVWRLLQCHGLPCYPSPVRSLGLSRWPRVAGGAFDPVATANPPHPRLPPALPQGLQIKVANLFFLHCSKFISSAPRLSAGRPPRPCRGCSGATPWAGPSASPLRRHPSPGRLRPGGCPAGGGADPTASGNRPAPASQLALQGQKFEPGQIDVTECPPAATLYADNRGGTQIPPV